MKIRNRFLFCLIFCIALSCLAGCGLTDRIRNDLNPLYFLDGSLYAMDIGPSALTINKNGDVEDAEIYLLAKGKETTSHYVITFHKGDDAAQVTDPGDSRPFELTNGGYLMELRRVLMRLIDEFSSKAMEVRYVSLGYNQDLSRYTGLYYYAYNGDSLTKVTAETQFSYNNYLEVTVGENLYFVALGTNKLK